jgi:hypothetical protein
MNLQKMWVWKVYLALCIGSLLGGFVMALGALWKASANGYQVLILTNVYGESLWEIIVLTTCIPGITYLCYDMARRIKEEELWIRRKA